MEIATIIGIATRVIELANRAIDAANNGDKDKAEEYLKQAQDVWTAAAAEYLAAEPEDT